VLASKRGALSFGVPTLTHGARRRDTDVADRSFCQSWMETIGWSFGIPTLTHGVGRRGGAVQRRGTILDPDHPKPQSNVTYVVGLKCYQGR
jgi:hypothetical protein